MEYTAEKSFADPYSQYVNRGDSSDQKTFTTSQRHLLNGSAITYISFHFVLYVM